MRIPFIMGTRQTDAATPETSHGGPVYDARIDPAITADDIVGSERLAQQRNLHLFDSKSAPAAAFSHFTEQSPSPLAARMAGLASSRDQIERITSRKDWPPFPGVELGHVPAFANSPSMSPVLAGTAHLTHSAHLNGAVDTQQASKRGRRRFGQ